MGCGEDMVVALNVDFQKIGYWIEAVENAEHVAKEEGAPIMNLDANFLIPEEERHVDFAFPRLRQLQEMGEIALSDRSLVPVEGIPEGLFGQRPYRRPDYAEEWGLLRKAWSLHRRGRDLLAQQRIASASDLLYRTDPLRDLRDWVWRFALFIGQPNYEAPFSAAIGVVRPILRTSGFMELAGHYDRAAEERGSRYFALIKSYFEGYGDFGQIHFHVAKGMDVPEGNMVSSVDFDATRMFYGNAFEAFASSVDILAYLNNLLAGRSFDRFERLTQRDYLKLDKAKRFEAFAGVPELIGMCEERDNQLRNASHHGGMRLDSKTLTIRYRTGNGGTGPEQHVNYAQYLARCAKLFLQSMTLLRLEILISYATGLRPPL